MSYSKIAATTSSSGIPIGNSRPRSLIVEVEGDAEFNSLWDTLNLAPQTKDFCKQINGLFETKKGLWMLSFKPGSDSQISSCREAFLLSTEGIIDSPHGRLLFTLPSGTPVRISIKGIPDETPFIRAAEVINKLNCGKLKSATKNWHRGTTIYNGYTTFIIEDFEKDKLPDFVTIDGIRCKTYLPKDLYIPTCGRCLKKCHNFMHCDSPPVCRYCKEEGHIKRECPEWNERQRKNLQTSWHLPSRKTITTNDNTQKRPNINTKLDAGILLSPKTSETTRDEIQSLGDDSNKPLEVKEKRNENIDIGKEIKDWSLSEDPDLSSPHLSPQSPIINNDKTSKKKEISTTPYRLPNLGKTQVKVLVHDYETRDLSSSSIYSDLMEACSAPAYLESEEYSQATKKKRERNEIATSSTSTNASIETPNKKRQG
uniref:uncharacterized protein LOC120347729 n=1 Tax=Styela clava TaxID=7725 RepID=UPI00193A5712|nr:uncharacterized protein LOC120347729 [Styela clava]